MVGQSGKFFIYFNEKEQEILVEKFGVTEKSELRILFKKLILSKSENIPLQNIDSNDLDTKIKQANLRIKNATATIKEHEVKYIETFDKKPSLQGEKALKIHAESKTRELNKEEKENVTRYLTIKNIQNKWQAKCDLCHDGATYETYLEMLNDMVQHLTTEHSKNVMRIQR